MGEHVGDGRTETTTVHYEAKVQKQTAMKTIYEIATSYEDATKVDVEESGSGVFVFVLFKDKFRGVLEIDDVILNFEKDPIQFLYQMQKLLDEHIFEPHKQHTLSLVTETENLTVV